MKRDTLVVLFVAAMFAAAPLSAQNTYGLIVGFATGKMSEDFEGNSTTDDDDAAASPLAGFWMRRPLTGSISFAPEGFFVAKGDNDDDSDGRIKMAYFEIPLLLRFDVPTSGNLKPFLIAGPAVGLQLSCKVSDASGDRTESCDEVFGEEDSYKKVDGDWRVSD